MQKMRAGCCTDNFSERNKFRGNNDGNVMSFLCCHTNKSIIYIKENSNMKITDIRRVKNDKSIMFQ